MGHLEKFLWLMSSMPLINAQNTTISSSLTPTTSLAPTTTVPSISSATVVVDASGNGQFTAINAAISYAQTFSRPVVLVRAGVYAEAVAVLGSFAITIVGETPDTSDYSQNTVTISNSVTPMSINSNSVKGITWRNINFVNTATGTAPAVSLRGTKNAFYNCQFTSAGGGVITSTLGVTLIANSYIEGADKLFSGYLGLYVFGTKIVPTASSATIVYSRGYLMAPVQISQTVLDSCRIVQKPGLSNTYVWLAAANGEGAQTVFKYTSMASFIAPGGTKAVGLNGFFGEYATTGPGSFQSDKARVDTLMTTSILPNFTINYVFANSFPGYAAPTTEWIDVDVLRAIVAANSEATQISISSSALSTTTSLTSTSSTISSTTSESLSISTRNSTISTTSSAAIPSSTCLAPAIPSSIPATALIVGTVECSPGNAACKLKGCGLPIVNGGSRLAVYNSRNKSKNAAFYHIECFELIANLTKRDYFRRVQPLIQATWRERGLKPISALDGSFFCAGGIERCPLPSPEFTEILYMAGSSKFTLVAVPDMPMSEAILLRTSLAPYESDGLGDTSEWNLFDAYIDKDPSSLDDCHSLSKMIKLWEIDEKVANQDDESLSLQDRARKIALGEKAIRGIQRLPATHGINMQDMM